MKRILVSVLACVMMGLSFAVAPLAHAIPLFAAVEAPPTTTDPLAELKAKIVPQLEAILTPEQRTQLEDAIANGTSVKKAFKSIALTPEQKGKVGMMMKSVPKDYFTSLTPAQKRELFMQKKDFFMTSGKAKAEAAMQAASEKVEEVTKAASGKVDDAVKAVQDVVD
ncbi:hypothetical protein [Leptolyngbya sp. NIES-2104]|uniref:hypothetical protein n=1 Tax=Leptolyngbya sp. NIES-2104 TaxID=1552121 RepID=UPI0006EC8118|nr:hypothetical protein [Leptolyngbya sp. NIES-2104]GAP95246.1 hypothetical protein NIES2104_17660 [Leptolyngbya sp. NIES-2104]